MRRRTRARTARAARRDPAPAPLGPWRAARERWCSPRCSPPVSRASQTVGPEPSRALGWRHLPVAWQARRWSRSPRPRWQGPLSQGGLPWLRVGAGQGARRASGGASGGRASTPSAASRRGRPCAPSRPGRQVSPGRATRRRASRAHPSTSRWGPWAVGLWGDGWPCAARVGQSAAGRTRRGRGLASCFDQATASIRWKARSRGLNQATLPCTLSPEFPSP